MGISSLPGSNALQQPPPGKGRDARSCPHTCEEQLANQMWIDVCCAASKPPPCIAGLHQVRAHAIGASQGFQGRRRGRRFVQSVLLPCSWFEVDQLEVLQYKARLLKSAGAATKVSHAQQVSSR